MNTTANTRSMYTIVPALAFILFALPVWAQTLRPNDKPAVVETEDGMILIGKIEKVEEETATVQSIYGALRIPLFNILRIDGDTFDPLQGIIREHEAVIRQDGSVILEYLQPVTPTYKNRKVKILTLGNILSIHDLNGEPLDYMARKIGDLTRCSVTMPDYRLPAIRVQVIQTGAADIQNNQISYTYRYTPRMEQTFNLKLTYPAGMTVIETSPEPADQTSDMVQWQETLRRQQITEFTITLQIP